MEYTVAAKPSCNTTNTTCTPRAVSMPEYHPRCCGGVRHTVRDIGPVQLPKCMQASSLCAVGVLCLALVRTPLDQS